MVPAISPAFGRLKPRKTRNDVGATTALNRSAAPNHKPSRNNLRLFIIAINRIWIFPEAKRCAAVESREPLIRAGLELLTTKKAPGRAAPDSRPDQAT